MIEHMVLLKVKAIATTEEEQAMLSELRSLKNKISEIVDLTCGKNFSDRSQGFTHGLLVRFRTQADLQAYVVHPEHQRIVAERIRPIVESVLALDFDASAH